MQRKISDICKKHPKLNKFFLELKKEDNNFSTDILSEIIHLYEVNKFILREKNFNIFSYSNLESIYDEMNQVIIYEKTKIFLKRETSSKTRELFNNRTIDLLNDAVLFGLDLHVLKSDFFYKLNSYNSSKSLNNALKKYINQNKTNDVLSILKKSSKYNTNLIKIDLDRQLLILKINDFQASHELGSPSWCISSSRYQWDSYINKHNRYLSSDEINMKNLYNSAGFSILNEIRHQIFIWDLHAEDPNNSMIGMTYNNNFSVLHYSHARNDQKIDFSLKNYLTNEEISALNLLCNQNNYDEHPPIDILIKKLHRKVAKKKILTTIINLRRDDVVDYCVSNLQDDYKTLRYVSDYLIEGLNFSGTNIFNINNYIKTHKDILKINPKIKNSGLSLSKILSLKFTYDDENLLEQMSEAAKYFSSFNLDSFENIQEHLMNSHLKTTKKLNLNDPDHKLLITNHLLSGALKYKAQLNIAILLLSLRHESNNILAKSIKEGIDISYLKIQPFVLEMSRNEEFCNLIFDNLEIHSEFDLEPVLINLYKDCSPHFLKRLVNFLFENGLGIEPLLAHKNESFRYNPSLVTKWKYTKPNNHLNDNLEFIYYNSTDISTWKGFILNSDFIANCNIDNSVKKVVLQSLLSLSEELIKNKDSILWLSIKENPNLVREILLDKYPYIVSLFKELNLFK